MCIPENITQRALIVDDDSDVRDTIVDLLRQAGFEALGVADGAAMDLALSNEVFSFVMIDLKLHREDGLALARDLRLRSRIPILILTGQGDRTDLILGLETVADDFMTKPFDNRELVARVRALLRRTSTVEGADGCGSTTPRQRFKFGRWVADLTGRQLADETGHTCELTPAEFGLLEAFVHSPNRPLSRSFLLTATRGIDALSTERTIDVLVLRLRRKIERTPDSPEYISTERGQGYQFRAELVHC